MNSSLLPSDLHKFPQPSLVVVANHIKASFWMVRDDQITLSNELNPQKLQEIDTNAGHVPGQENHIDMDHLKQHAKTIAEKINHLIEGSSLVTYSLVVPSDLHQPILDHLSAPTRAALHKYIDADVIHESISQIMMRLLA